MKSHISAIENYFNGSPHFSSGRQENVAELFLLSSNFLDSNDEKFHSNVTYNITLRQSVCCLVCGKRSTQMVDKNRCLYLSIEDRASGTKNTIYDLTNAYFEEYFLEGHYCDSLKSSNTALAKKFVNTPEVITCVIKRYENQKATSKLR